MIIMALDHVRDFLHITAVDQQPTNLATTTPLLFFTRWITHFCAPTFVFLSGISAWLSGRKKSRKELSIFLIKRGIWLILFDIIGMSLAFTFNPAYDIFILEVLWAIGGSMIILGLLVRVSTRVIIITGLIILFGHNLFDYIQVQNNTAGGVLLRLFVTGSGGIFPLGSKIVLAGYTIIPWTGVMLLGYAAGSLYNAQYSMQWRRKILLLCGFASISLFIVLRLINGYGDPSHWAVQKDGVFTFLSFVNTSKYPPSLDFVCMTVGPIIILLALLESVQNRFTAFATVYGKVPFFYFVVHFCLVHIITVIAFFASGYGWKDRADPKSLFLFRPAHFGFELWGVYAVWLGVVLIMYWPCKWFGRYKATHTYGWLSYV